VHGAVPSEHTTGSSSELPTHPSDMLPLTAVPCQKSDDLLPADISSASHMNR